MQYYKPEAVDIINELNSDMFKCNCCKRWYHIRDQVEVGKNEKLKNLCRPCYRVVFYNPSHIGAIID